MAAYVGGNGTIRKGHVNYAIEHISDDATVPAKGHSKVVVYGLSSAVLIALVIFGVVKFVHWPLSLRDISYTTTTLTQSAPVAAQKTAVAPEQPAPTVETRPAPAIEARQVETRQAPKKVVTVIVDSANLREEPSMESEVVSWVSRDSMLRVIDEFTGPLGKKWYKVKIMGGKECWIADRVVELSER